MKSDLISIQFLQMRPSISYHQDIIPSCRDIETRSDYLWKQIYSFDDQIGSSSSLYPSCHLLHILIRLTRPDKDISQPLWVFDTSTNQTPPGFIVISFFSPASSAQQANEFTKIYHSHFNDSTKETPLHIVDRWKASFLLYSLNQTWHLQKDRSLKTLWHIKKSKPYPIS